MILNSEFTPDSNPVKICQVFMTQHRNTQLPYGIAPSGYRLPAPARLGRVLLQVSDLARSAAFYQQVLGLREVARDDTQISLAPENADPLVVLQHVPGTRAIAPRARLGLFHFAILLPDRAALGRFVAHLAQHGIRAGAADHLVSEALYLSDPDGLGIEVYADRPRAQWQHHDRQLAMASEPLDLRALVAAAGSTVWMGMPAGTVMGHVHLHVGDLDRAADFYHTGLGLDKVVWNYPGALFLAAGGYHHHLGLNTWAAGAAAPGPLDAQLLEWEMILPSPNDVSAARASITAAGFPAEPDGGAVCVRDPWGTTLRLRT